MRATLRSLPKTLDETYDRILAGINETDRCYAFRALQWLAFSARPVYVEEVAEAMVVDLDCELPRVEHDRALRDPHDLVDICSGLVRLSSSGGEDYDGVPKQVLQFAHFSVKEYLVSSRIGGGPSAGFGLHEAQAHKALAECCIAYMLHFERLMSRSELLAYPLAHYSARYGPYHARRAGPDIGTIQRLGTKLVLPERTGFENCLRLYDVEDWPSGLGSFRRGEPLYYMALYGVHYLALALIRAGADVNARGGHCGTALQAASYEGHHDVVQLLLDNGADVRARGGTYGCALTAASAKGHVEVVRLLLDNGADASAIGGVYESALRAAAAQGYPEIVQLLIDRGADLSAQKDMYTSALGTASAKGHLDVVRQMLANVADASAKRGLYGVALPAASRGGRLEIVKWLLADGADARARGGEYGGTLQAAAAGGSLDIARLLLDNGADVNAYGGSYGSALRAASMHGHNGMVQLLLDKGADVNAKVKEVGSALQAAYDRGLIKTVQLLLDSGADVYSLNYEHDALQRALAFGSLDLTKRLLRANHAMIKKMQYRGTPITTLSKDDLEVQRRRQTRNQGEDFGGRAARRQSLPS